MQQLTDQYYQEINTFSTLMKECLVSDSNTEIIDFDDTFEKTVTYVNKNGNDILSGSRRTLIKYLNGVWMQWDNLPDQWLFEMSYRIRKLIAIAIPLESIFLSLLPIISRNIIFSLSFNPFFLISSLGMLIFHPLAN
jgi:hypothetical protein